MITKSSIDSKNMLFCPQNHIRLVAMKTQAYQVLTCRNFCLFLLMFGHVSCMCRQHDICAAIVKINLKQILAEAANKKITIQMYGI